MPVDSDPGRQLWFVDVDCVWLDPSKVFGAGPVDGRIGCIEIPYPAEWEMNGTTPQRLGELGLELGDCPTPLRTGGRPRPLVSGGLRATA